MLNINLKPSLGLRCLYCKTRDGHSPYCLQAQLDELCRRRKYIECPKCGKNAVDVNQGDYYECRGCHTQYTTGERDGSFERTFLVINEDIPIDEGVKIVLVLPQKGVGKFPIDERIASLKLEVEAKIAPKRKNKKRA